MTCEAPHASFKFWGGPARTFSQQRCLELFVTVHLLPSPSFLALTPLLRFGWVLGQNFRSEQKSFTRKIDASNNNAPGYLAWGISTSRGVSPYISLSLSFCLCPSPSLARALSLPLPPTRTRIGYCGLYSSPPPSLFTQYLLVLLRPSAMHSPHDM